MRTLCDLSFSTLFLGKCVPSPPAFPTIKTFDIRLKIPIVVVFFFHIDPSIHETVFPVQTAVTTCHLP
jgi:hypothetical protein